VEVVGVVAVAPAAARMSAPERKPGPSELGANVLVPEPEEAWSISAQEGQLIISVANWPKFLPQNAKVAGKNYKRQKKTGADSAPKLGQKGQKSGQKKMLGIKDIFIRQKSQKPFDYYYKMTSSSFCQMSPAQFS
jgi:hypothetical protein